MNTGPRQWLALAGRMRCSENGGLMDTSDSWTMSLSLSMPRMMISARWGGAETQSWNGYERPIK
jgi:hypothetical protein